MKKINGAPHYVTFTFLPLLALGLVTAVFLTTPVTEYRQGFDWDGSFYAVTAGTTTIFPESTTMDMLKEAPYCHRILSPYLVSLIPLPTLTSFRLMAYVSNILSLILLFLFLKKIGFPDKDCFIGILLYAGIFWTLKFSFYSPALTDYHTQLLLLLILYFTITKHYALLSIVLTVAMLQKESFPIYIVFGAFVFIKEQRWPLTRRADLLLAFMTVTPLAAFLMIRLMIPQVNTYTPLRIFVRPFMIFRLSFWPRFLQAVFSGLGMLAPLLLAHHRPWRNFLSRYPEWIVYLCLSMILFFGGGQQSRYFLYGLPLIVVLTLCVLQDIERRLSKMAYWLWFSVFLGIHIYVGGYLTQMGTFKEYIARTSPFLDRLYKVSFTPFLVRNCLFACVVVLATRWLLRRSEAS